MNDKYLWDKSGEPDEEIQHLESLLSEFRYQSRPLVLPEAMHKRMIFSYANTATLRYAAIAAVALLALGLGLWLRQRPADKQQPIAQQQTATPAPSLASQQEVTVKAEGQTATPRQQIVKHLATTPTREVRAHKRILTRPSQSEGERAKEKVLYALQITSKQLDAITKKIQTDTN